MAETAKNKLPYPEETDGVDPAKDIKALAEKLDLIINTAIIIPIGGEIEYAGENDPNANFLIENGRELSRAAYPELFALVGTKYGVGNGSTTFNIPDCRGRASIGAGTGAGLTARALAAKLGEENHKLTGAESPDHVHQVWPYFSGGANNGAPGHSDPWPGQNSWALECNILFVGPGGAKNWQNFTNQLGNTSGAFDAATGVEQAGGSHNNMQPVIVKNKLIRAL